MATSNPPPPPPLAGPEEPPAAPKRAFSANVMPVSIKQILDCKHDKEKTVGTLEMSMLRIIGVVTDHVRSIYGNYYIVDDRTGTIHAESDPSNAMIEVGALKQGAYTSFTGYTSKNAHGSHVLYFWKASPLTDLNELTCHLLEVAIIPLRLKKQKEKEDSDDKNNSKMEIPSVKNPIEDDSKPN